MGPHKVGQGKGQQQNRQSQGQGQDKKNKNFNNNKNQNDTEYIQKQNTELAAKAAKVAKVAKIDTERARAEREADKPDNDTYMNDYDEGVYELRVQTARVDYVQKPTVAAPSLQQAVTQPASQPFQQQSLNFVP